MGFKVAEAIDGNYVLEDASGNTKTLSASKLTEAAGVFSTLVSAGAQQTQRAAAKYAANASAMTNQPAERFAEAVRTLEKLVGGPIAATKLAQLIGPSIARLAESLKG